METRQIDVSELAHFSALALLAAKVKLTLGRVKRARATTGTQDRRIRGAISYLNRLLDGLRALRASGGSMRPPGPDQLNAIDSYMAAAGALHSSANHCPAVVDAGDTDAIEETLERMKSELESVLSGSHIDPADISRADTFFAALADYANAEHEKILRASSA